jgi:hypothetical protein
MAGLKAARARGRLGGRKLFLAINSIGVTMFIVMITQTMEVIE